MSDLMPIADVLGDAEVFTDGDWVESKDQDPDGEVRLTQLADVGDGKWINKSARFLTPEKAKQLRCTYLKPGDLLVARMPDPLGRCCVFPGDPMPCVTVVDVCVIRPNQQKVDNGYLMHVINAPHGRQGIARHITGTTRQRISRKNLGKVQIPLPPLAEQKRIARILDAADALRAKRRESLAQPDTLLRSTFLDMFGDPVTNPMGWETKDLSSVCRKITDGTHHSPPICENGIPYITAKHLKKDGLRFFQSPWYVSPKHHAEIFARCDPQRDDVLYIKDGATTGIAAVNHYDFEFSMLSSLALLRPSPELILSEYLGAYLNNDRNKSHLIENMGGAAIKRLTLAKIKRFLIPLPPLDLQRRFTAIVESVEQQKASQRAHLAELDTLFASLQSRAFRGDL